MNDDLLFNEREFIANLLHHDDYILKTPIKSNYFEDKEHQKLFKYMQECYKRYGLIEAQKMYEMHQDWDFNLLVDIYTNTFFFQENFEERIKLKEETIINSYKRRVLVELNKQLNENKLTYDDYFRKVEILNNIKVSNEEESILAISDIDMSKDEIIERVKSNTASLDQAIKGFGLGQLSVWSGGNASAKSTYLNQIAIESIEQGYKVAIYSGELVSKRLVNWIVTQCAGAKNIVENQEKGFSYVKAQAKDKILNWLNGELYIYNNLKGNGVNQIINAVRYTITKLGVKVIILDNLMSMNLTDYGDSKYDTQSILIQNLSNLAKELNVHIHFVCHPRKSIGFLRKTDISGTADLTNIADNVFIMHRTNNDFKIKTKEMFGWNESSPIYKYSNVIEVCKNRDFGVEDCFIGMYFQKESRRLLDYENEERIYSWEFTM